MADGEKKAERGWGGGGGGVLGCRVRGSTS